MIYLDTSVLVSLHVGESNSELTLEWFSRQDGQVLAISDLVALEFACAIRRKVRSNRLGPDDALRAESKFAETLRSSLLVVAVPAESYWHATSMVRQSPTPLRAADALHLAIARANDAAMATLDMGLAQAARFFETEVADILP